MRNAGLRSLCVLVCVAIAGATARAQNDVPIPVDLVITPGGAHLEREGQVFQVKGAGGDESFELLAASGGNTARTWGVGSDTRAILDEAHANGLTVSLGIWLGHERHGFNYNNPSQVAAQLEAARQAVLEFRDHPAVLVWGIGNEMEGFASGDNDAIWDHVEDVAAMVKSLDPNHPTMTVIAEVGGARIPKIHQRCPSIDIVGINSYGGVTSIPQRYRSAGGTKPYMVTEFGIWGDNETGQTAWGEPYEPSSTAKGPVFANAYNILEDDALCLGSIAFLWGNKREATITWHGMFLADGSKLQAVDDMTAAWGGGPLTNRCPRIESFGIPGNAQFDGFETIVANLVVNDPDGDDLTVTYSLLEETNDPGGGDGAPVPPSYPGALVSGDLSGATLTAPNVDRALRLYVFVRDGNGAAATASAPLYTFAVDEPDPIELPVSVYGQADSPWTPSGYMGNPAAISMDFAHTDNPDSAPECLRVSFATPGGFGGVAWQNPANNWGTVPGGIDLTGATRLRFRARGEQGGERVSFGFGIIGPTADFPDSGSAEAEVVLTQNWRTYEIDTGGVDMSSIVTGFYWLVGAQPDAVTFFLDDIEYRGCDADINGDGVLNNTDINGFVTLFLFEGPETDLNGDGVWNNADINLFVQQFLAGC